MTENEKIHKASKYEYNECSCERCQNMCKRSPCLGTPSDILRIINNGYGQHFTETSFLVPAYFGEPAQDMYQARQNRDNGHCPFFSDGKCVLHNLGIKPIEGKLATCDRSKLQEIPFAALAVSETWSDPANAKIISLIAKAVEKYSKNEENQF